MTEHDDEGPLTLRSFAAHARQAAPATIHHYTSQRGLLGIIQNSELWATKVQYMDDATEFGLALRIARKSVAARLDKAGERDGTLLRQMSKLDGIENVNIFVACFCEHGDLLGQWRAYSGASHGFAIAMKSSKLSELAGLHHFRLRQCIYETARQHKVIDEAIDACLKLGENPLQCGAAFERLLVQVGAFFKDPSFAEEREWRLVSYPTRIQEPNVGFREGRSMLTPYFRLPLGDKLDEVIEGITVGPCPHLDLSANSVRALCIREGIRKNARWGGGYEVNVRYSAVPYRNW